MKFKGFNFHFKSAFTLAEVLITLGIIGVVAALTIPTLMQKTQDKELKTAWKKTFSTLSQVTERITEEEGSLSHLCNTNFDSNCFMNYYKPYMSVAKTCLRGSVTGKDNCFPDVYYDYYKALFYSNFRNESNNLFSGFILNDGTSVLFELRAAYCDEQRTNNEGETVNICGYALVDVNGFKKPNAFGHDIFRIVITPDKLVAEGAKGYDFGESKSCPQKETVSANVTSCAYQYLIE